MLAGSTIWCQILPIYQHQFWALFSGLINGDHLWHTKPTGYIIGRHNQEFLGNAHRSVSQARPAQDLSLSIKAIHVLAKHHTSEGPTVKTKLILKQDERETTATKNNKEM
jgi:hypothetical protein